MEDHVLSGQEGVTSHSRSSLVSWSFSAPSLFTSAFNISLVSLFPLPHTHSQTQTHTHRHTHSHTHILIVHSGLSRPGLSLNTKLGDPAESKEVLPIEEEWHLPEPGSQRTFLGAEPESLSPASLFYHTTPGQCLHDSAMLTHLEVSLVPLTQGKFAQRKMGWWCSFKKKHGEWVQCELVLPSPTGSGSKSSPNTCPLLCL